MLRVSEFVAQNIESEGNDGKGDDDITDGSSEESEEGDELIIFEWEWENVIYGMAQFYNETMDEISDTNIITFSHRKRYMDYVQRTKAGF